MILFRGDSLFKYLYILFLSCLLFACSDDERNLATSISTSPTNLPPPVFLQLKDHTYPTTQGSYCWKNGRNTECIDKISPISLVSEVEPIALPKNSSIKVHVEKTPTSESLTMINLKDDKTDEIKISNSKFKTPKKKGHYLFIYYAVWEDDGTNTAGDSAYVFKTEVK